MVWGCKLSDDVNGKYVEYVLLEADTISNIKAKGGVADPERIGKVFDGWAVTVEGKKEVYTTAQITEIPVGTYLVAQWKDAPVVETPEEEGDGAEDEVPEGENPEGGNTQA